MKEMIRKFLVSLKKNPQAIPLLAHTVAFCVFSLNLTDVSKTTNMIQGTNMGLCAFITMLFSILAYVCLFSAYPKRKKPNWIMIALIMAMYVSMVFTDSYYRNCVYMAVKGGENPIQITETTMYINDAYQLMSRHITTLIVSAVLIVLEPVYAKLLKKINTSIDIEDNGDLGAIELSDEK